jgi:hypothetical protein
MKTSNLTYVLRCWKVNGIISATYVLLIETSEMCYALTLANPSSPVKSLLAATKFRNGLRMTRCVITVVEVKHVSLNSVSVSSVLNLE